jgi:hypothetical protein
MYTLDTAQPNSCAIANNHFPPSYLHTILILIYKSMALPLREKLLSPSGAYLSRTMAQDIKIFLKAKANTIS